MLWSKSKQESMGCPHQSQLTRFAIKGEQEQQFSAQITVFIRPRLAGANTGRCVTPKGEYLKGVKRLTRVRWEKSPGKKKRRKSKRGYVNGKGINHYRITENVLE